MSYPDLDDEKPLHEHEVHLENEHEDEDEHEEHIDERWLVSYSDMMTLLFGLFVMLYSMQSPDQMQKMKDSIQDRFESTKAENVPKENLQAIIDDLKKQIEELKKKEIAFQEQEKKITDELTTAQTFKEQNEKLQAMITEITQEKDQLKDQVAAVKDTIKKTKKQDDKVIKMSQKIEELETQLSLKNNQLRKIASVEDDKKIIRQKEDEISQVQQKMKELQKQLDLKDNQLRQVASVPDLKPEVNKLQNELNDKQQVVDNLQKKNTEIEKRYEDLKSKILSQKHYLTVITNWSTNEHDLDLTVKDPTGKVFDFKKRKFPNNPGSFVLDSRRGPGIEVWQTEDMIPGRYEAKVTFYNQYSNLEPAKAKLTLFSSNGKIELPEFQLDMTQKNSFLLAFNVDKDGNITLEK